MVFVTVTRSLHNRQLLFDGYQNLLSALRDWNLIANTASRKVVHSFNGDIIWANT